MEHRNRIMVQPPINMGHTFDLAGASAPRVRADTLDRDRDGLTILPIKAWDVVSQVNH